VDWWNETRCEAGGSIEPARHVAHLLDADIGRPLADLATHLDHPDLLSDAASVRPSPRQ
jgi:hypothetical protein